MLLQAVVSEIVEAIDNLKAWHLVQLRKEQVHEPLIRLGTELQVFTRVGQVVELGEKHQRQQQRRCL
jgi:hypothetical protein